MARRRAKRTISEIRRNALKCGYRSGLEVELAKQIELAGHEVLYEVDKIDFVWPQRSAQYTPDFKVAGANGGFFYVEGKGIFSTEDRHKHLLIKKQCPDVEIRFVFSNSKSKLYRNSPTSYADWCRQHGFQFADKTIPEEWLQEGENDNEKPEQQDPRSPQEDGVDLLGGSE